MEDCNGRKRPRKTTKGWQLQVKWSDGTKSWIDLKVLKESNPVDVAEFSIARGIDDEPAFSWWVPYTMKKRKAIISAITARARKVSHKYGIEIPTGVENAKDLDARTGNCIRQIMLEKEIYELEEEPKCKMCWFQDHLLVGPWSLDIWSGT